MKYSSRFWLYAPIATFVIIAGLVMAHWWVVANAFEKKLAALKGHEAVPGITLDWGSVTVGGFPFPHSHTTVSHSRARVAAAFASSGYLLKL